MKSKLPNYIFDWTGLITLFAGAFAGVLVFALVDVISTLFFKTSLQYQHTETFLLLSNIGIWIGAILAFDFFICRPQTKKKLNFNFSTKNLSTYILVFPMMLGMMLISEFITNIIPTKGFFFGYMYEKFSKMMEHLSADQLLMFIMAVIMAPIFEEIVFRGIILKGWLNNGRKPLQSIWASAFIFGLVHGNLWQFVGAVLLGYVLGYVYYKTKSLLMPILLHFFNNGISMLLLTEGNTESFSEFFGISKYITLGIGIVLFTIFYHLFTKKTESCTKNN